MSNFLSAESCICSKCLFILECISFLQVMSALSPIVKSVSVLNHNFVISRSRSIKVGFVVPYRVQKMRSTVGGRGGGGGRDSRDEANNGQTLLGFEM